MHGKIGIVFGDRASAMLSHEDQVLELPQDINMAVAKLIVGASASETDNDREITMLKEKNFHVVLVSATAS
ncbi:MAG: hypothetical protein M3480_03495 [Verrucomicrobiota bacterium]|nr:hypothetical protein [Chthoniobacterales bacterium]MDQ3414029.1 hypothetical protein [Verrucomicrobiota bacterium]